MRLTTLRRRSDFDQAFEHGESCRTDGVRLFARENGLELTRFGFVITTRVGGAVVRNRVRRWCREVCRAWLARFKPGYDVVILVHRQEAAANFADFRLALRRACHTLKLAGGLND